MSDASQKIVVRFAPSPTGHLHIGGVRTALFNFLFARKHGGRFILRIEDTDKERSKKEYEESIVEALKWLSLTHDELHRQSERAGEHRAYLKKLIDSDAAYISKETPKEPGDREEVIRFKNPNKKVSFKDSILGDIEFDTTDLGDFVIAKDFDTPLYHLAVVADDFDMGVTHIIRAQEHISNTPRQILIQEAIGAPRSEYAHIPLILAPDKSKLSKRHGAVGTEEYRDQGYLPEALVNYLALLGWNPGGDQEILTMDELIEKFSLEKIQKSGAVFDIEKLKWVNKEHLLKLPAGKREEGMRAFLPSAVTTRPSWDEKIFTKLIPLLEERIHIYSDVKKLADDGELAYFFEYPDWDVLDIINIIPSSIKGKEGTVDNSGVMPVIKSHLQHIVNILSTIPEGEQFSPDTIKNMIWDYATEHGRGNVLWPMRYALTGREKSPDPFTVASIIGKDASVRRLQKAIDIL